MRRSDAARTGAQLAIGNGFTLPVEAVTQTFAVLAKRGAGKTYTALVVVEEFLRAGQQVVIADPVGVTWGLRADASGTGPGLPIVVLGGDHGDVPLEVTAGATIADFVVQERQSVVLDLSRFRKGEQVRFMTDFAERLYHQNRGPLHLVLDEADAFAPQRPMPGEQRMLGAVEDLVRRGRARGIGVTLVTQRAAVLNKDVLTQVEVLVALRTIAPQDRDAIDAWVRVHGTPAQREALMASLPSLQIGTAWFWSPGWLDVFRRVQVRRRRTFDSSATPQVGETRRAPTAMAAVDLAALRTRIAATIEQVRQNDPRELRARISTLEGELAAAKRATPTPQRVEVPALTDRERQCLQAVATRLEGATTTWAAQCAALTRVGEALRAEATGLRQQLAGRLKPAAAASFTPPGAPPAHARTARTARPADESAVRLDRCARAILTVLVQHPEGCEFSRLTLLAGYRNSGGFRNALGLLRSAGFIAGGNVEIMRATEAGVAALGTCAPLPTGRALVDYWLSHQSLDRCARAILAALVHAPDGLTREQIMERTEYADSGGFRNALGALRTARLLVGRNGEQMRACEELLAALG